MFQRPFVRRMLQDDLVGTVGDAAWVGNPSAVCRGAVSRRRAAIDSVPSEVGRCLRGLVLVDKGTSQLGVWFARVEEVAAHHG